MRTSLEKVIHFGTSDHGLTIFLALLVMVVFVLPPIVTPSPAGRLVLEAFFSLLLIAGTIASIEQRWARLVIPPIVLAAVAVHWISFASGADLWVWREISALTALSLFIYVLASRIYRRGPITGQRIHGAIAVYILLGLGWGSIYEFLYHLDPHAFAGALGDAPTAKVWIYYSLATLTTAGYGDITPLDPIARSASVLEALTGQLYLAITIARLVASQKSRDEE